MPYRDRFPVLDLELATPCGVRWDMMIGDERTRHCHVCDRNVYDLGELTREQAVALIHEREGQLCVRYLQRPDGRVILRDCSDALMIRPSPAQIALYAVLILAGATTLLFLAWHCAFGGHSLGSVGY